MIEPLSLTQPGPAPGPPPQKSPGLAFLLSFLLPGVGQLYCGKLGGGFWTLGGFVASVIGLVVLSVFNKSGEVNSIFAGLLLRSAIILYGFGFLDAFLTAREVSSGRDRLRAFNPRVAAVLNLLTRGFGYYYLGEKKRAFWVFFVVGVLARINLELHNLALDILLELILIGLAADAYRLAKKLDTSPPEPTLPYREEGRDVLAGLAYTLAGLLALGYFGLGAWDELAPDFSTVDQTRAVFAVQQGKTIYQNPRYGVSLRLPGTWTQDEADADEFCELVNADESLFASFTAEAIFPTTTLDHYMKSFHEAAHSRGGTIVEMVEKPLRVNGRPARMLTYRLQSDKGEIVMAVLVLKKGLSAYAVTLSAPVAAMENWRRAADILPGTIEIK